MSDFKSYNLEYFIHYLDDIPVIDESKSQTRCRCTQVIAGIAHAIFKFFSLLWNLCFGDHKWYSTANAERVLRLYVAHWDEVKLNPTVTTQLREIYRRIGSPSDISIPAAYTRLMSDEMLNSLSGSNEEMLGKLFFHIHAHRFGGNSSLQGLTQSLAIDFLLQYLKASKIKSPAIDTFIEMLETTKQLCTSPNFIEDTQKAIKNAFITKKPLLIGTGWIEHGTYTLIIPKNEHTATVRIFNVGDGANKMHPEWGPIDTIHGIARYPAGVELENVSYEKLTDLKILQALHEITTQQFLPDSYGRSTLAQFGPIDIVQWVACLEASSCRLLQTKMPKQETGICAWYSLLAAFKSHLEDSEGVAGNRLFQVVKCNIRLESLFWESVFSEKTELCIHTGVRKLARTIIKLKQKHLIDASYVKAAEPVLERASAYSSKKSTISAIAPRDLKRLNWKFLGKMGDQTLASTLATAKEEQESAIIKPRSTWNHIEKDVMAIPLQITSENPYSLDSLKNTAILISIAYIVEDFSGAYSAALELTKRLSVNKEWWTAYFNQAHHSADPEKRETHIKSLICQLGEVSQTFFKSAFFVPKSEIEFSSTYYVLQKLNLIQNYLCLLVMNETTDMTLFFNQESHPPGLFRTSVDPIIIHDLLIMDNLNSLACRVGLKNEPTKLIRKFHRGEAREFWAERIIKADKTLLKRIRAQDKKAFDDYDVHQLDAQIYMNLPDWLAATRDGSLAAKYAALSMPIARSQSLKPDAGFLDWVFTLKQSDKYTTTLSISLTGITDDILHEFPGIERSGLSNKFNTMHGFPSDPVASFIDRMTSHKNTELQLEYDRNILGTNYEIPPMKYRAMEHLFVGKQSSVFRMIEYFGKNAKELSQREFQIIFHLLTFQLFDPQASIQELFPDDGTESIPLEHLLKFCQEQLKRSQDEEHRCVQTAVFMLRILRIIAEIALHRKPGNSFYQALLKQCHEELVKLMSDTLIEDHDQGVVCSEYMASLANKSATWLEPFSEAVQHPIDLLIQAKAISTAKTLPLKYVDPQREKDGLHAFEMHRQAIALRLNPRKLKQDDNAPLVMKAISRIAGLPEDTPWTIVCEPHESRMPKAVSKDSTGAIKYTFLPLEGRIIFNQGVTPSALPEAIRSDPLFMSRFPGQEKGIYLGKNIYQFEDPKTKRKTMVSIISVQNDKDKPTSVLAIDQEFSIAPKGKKWLRYVSRAEMSPAFKRSVYKDLPNKDTSGMPAILVARHDHWIDLNATSATHNTIFFEDGKGTLVYQARLVGENYRIFRSNGANLLEAPVKESVDIRIDVPANVLYFAEESEKESKEQAADSTASSTVPATFMELPRFNLSFTAKSCSITKTTVWESNEFPGYHLTDGCWDQLGRYRQQMILVHPSGKKKLIVPLYAFTPPKQVDVMAAHHEMDLKISSTVFHPISFDTLDYDVLDLDSSDKPSFPPGAFTLALRFALIMLVTHQYEGAAQLLKQVGKKLTHFTVDEASRLITLLKSRELTGDPSGEAVGIRAYAGYLLLEKAEGLTPEQAEDAYQATIKEYEAYSNQMDNSTAITLTPQEEITIIVAYLNKSKPNEFGQRCLSRLQELSPETAKQFSHISFASRFLARPSTYKAKVSEELLEKTLDKVIVPGKSYDFYPLTEFPNIYQLLLTRCAQTLSSKFAIYYNFCKSPETDKTSLIFALKWLYQSEKIEDRALAAVYGRTLMCDPATLPEFSKEFYKDEERLKKWVTDVRELVKKAPMPSWLSETEMKYKAAKLPIPTTLPTPSHLVPALSQTAIADILNWKVDADPLLTLEDTQKLLCRADSGKLSPAHLPVMASLLKPIEKLMENDRILRSEYVRLVSDEAELIKQEAATRIPLLDKNRIDTTLIAELEASLKEKSDRINPQQMKELELSIVADVNGSAERDAMIHMQGLAGKWKPWNLKTILANFGAQHPQSLADHNPLLTPEAIKTLYDKVHRYLRQKIHLNQVQRIQKEIEVFKTTRSQAVLDLIYQLSSAKPAYSMKDGSRIYSAALVFEYDFGSSNRKEFGMRLRPDQIETIKDFIASGKTGRIYEMIMGSGKSAVLIPLLGFLLAHEGRLALLVLPQSLYEEIAHQSQRTIERTLGRTTIALHFERSTPATVGNLSVLLRKLKDAKRYGNSVAVTSQSLKSIILKFVEMSQEHAQTLQLHKELDLMREIMKLIFEEGVPIFDEADSQFNVLRSILCYSMGASQKMDSIEVYVILQIYALLYNNLDLKAIARLNSDPHPDPKAPALTEEIYETRLKRKLAEKFLDSPLFSKPRIGTERDEKELKEQASSKEHSESVAVYADKPEIMIFWEKLPRMPLHEKEVLLDYLTHVHSKLKRPKSVEETRQFNEAQEAFDRLHRDVKVVFAMAGQMIGEFLGFCLTREYNKDYGRLTNSKSMQAVPFSAAQKPMPKSSFANSHITAAFTIQTGNISGIPEDRFEAVIKDLQSEALASRNSGKVERINETLPFKRFKKFCTKLGLGSMPLFHYSSTAFKRLHESMNANAQAKLDMMETLVIPLLELTPEQMSCTTHVMTSVFRNGKVNAFTGTLSWMIGSLNCSLTPKYQIGITTRIARKIMNSAVTVIKEGTPEELLKALAAIPAEGYFDAGAYLKDAQNDVVADLIQRFTDQPTLYYDQADKVCCKGSLELTLPPTRRKVFLDQPRTRGANHPFSPDAVGIVTIGPNTTLYDLEQAVYRLREIEKRQRVHFVITNTIEMLIRQTLHLDGTAPIGFVEIYNFVIFNQVAQMPAHRLTNFTQQLEGILQMIPLQVKRYIISPSLSLMERDDMERKRQAIVKSMAGLWHKQTNQGADIKYGALPSQESSEKIVAARTKAAKAQVEQYFKEHPYLIEFSLKKEELLESIDRLEAAMMGILPERIHGEKEVHDQALEMVNHQTAQADKQSDTDKQTDAEADQELSVSRSDDNTPKIFARLKPPNYKLGLFSPKEIVTNEHIFALPQYAEFDPHLKPYVAILSPKIQISPSLLIVQRWKTENFSLIGQDRIAIQFGWIPPDRSAIVLLGQNDFDDMPEENRKGLFHFTLGPCYCKPDAAPFNTLKREFAHELATVWFLQGRTSFTKEDRPILKAWLLEACKRVPMLKMIQLAKHITRYYGTRLEDSDLFTVLNEIQKEN